jgi:DNA-binding PadR family transcriptional regulator
MTLPEAPLGEGQALLQTVWDLAYAVRSWPTFAELDRRWDSRHDSDVIGILRQIPAGFITGYDARTEPQNSTKIGLTVAGAATCRNSQEVLAIFLDFIRVATTTEREWIPPSDDPDASPALTDQEYAKQARDLPAAGRSDLLRMLFQLVKSEPCGWGGLGGPDAEGHWTVTLDRRVRSFRGLADLDDYWSRRHKSWEPAQPEPAAAPAKPASADPRLMLLEAHLNILGPVLLVRIYAKAGSSTNEIVPCAEFQGNISPAKAEEALRRLESQGLVHLHWLDPAPALAYAQLTSTGAELAEQWAKDWDDEVRRDRAARNALLAWTRDQRDSPQGAALVAHFLRDRRSAHNGRFFSPADIDAAAAYLFDKGLIDGTFIEEQRGPAYAWLKAEGIDCIEHGGDVAAYLASKDSHVTTYTFNAPVSGTNVAVGHGATQLSVTQGIDAGALLTLVQAITEALPGLGLDRPQQAEAENAADGIAVESQQPNPDRSRLHRSLVGLRRVLAASGQQALAAVLRASVDYELAKLGLPPGS